jgi:2,4-dienoyl-CoA reductase-like NADH-dependent reductase (Old Yellow Enzyme family)
MPGLFDPFTLRDLTCRNRVGMSPMCQYRAQGDGVATDWHRAHYRARALGGAGLVLTEMTDVEARGRITDGCLGLWNDAQRDAFARLADDVHAEGASVGIQIAHAGRKSNLAHDLVAPSAIPFAPDRPTPRALATAEVEGIVEAFAAAARRAVAAGVDAIELHGAHGYLLQQVLSPVANRRDDAYGDPARFPLEVISAVRRELPAGMPLLMRLSLREVGEGGYDEAFLLALLPRFVAAGVDLFDVSSGGDAPVRPNAYPGYQLGLARMVRERVGVPVAAVGMLHAPELAEYAVRSEHADLVLVGRGMLRTPYWAHEAARSLGVALPLPGEYDKGL